MSSQLNLSLGGWRLFIRFLMVVSLATSSLSQGLPADFERAANLSKRMEKAYAENSVSPHWLASNDAFWYRRNLEGGKFEFILVDTLKGERRPAFDHQQLANALSDSTATKPDPEALPFTWIDVSRNASWVRFRIGDKTWQFDNGRLTPFSGDVNEEKLQSMQVELPSASSDVSTAITFINRTPGPLSLAWIDTGGEAVPYGTLEPGRPFRRQTYSGHVWRVTDPTTGKILGVYRATVNEAQAIITIPSKVGDTGLTKPKEEPRAAPPPNVEDASASKAGSRAFVRNFNVWVRDADGKETQISTNGKKDNPYRTYPLPATSPDGKFAAVWQYTPDQEHPLNLVESSPKGQLQPKLKSIPYLKPGDRVAVDRPRLFDLEAKKEVPTSDTLFQNPWSIENLGGWSADSSEYRFLFNQRGHQILRIIGISREGQVRTLVEETSKTFIDYSSKTYSKIIKGTNDLIWASERDGYNHLYLYDLKNATLKNQITKGEWMMRSVEKVDEQKKQIWFKGFGLVKGQDPYYAHLARINFDGTGLTILTEGDGTHTWKFSPDNKFITDTWSRVDLAPQSVLRNAETGKIVTELEKTDVKNLLAVGVTLPERFEALGRDGKTPIYGIIIKPSNFDANKKYPIIEQIYAGPQDFFVPKAFGTFTKQRDYAELGFIVVQIDGMGTNWRGKAFHNICYKNLKDGGFEDRIIWMKEAAKTRPWMDLSRVGIYGGSAGGQNALAAVLFHGDFYKAAAPDSGCHDNRMDKVWWNEQFMGWPVDKSYEDSSNVVHAGKLTGALMLIVGEMDTNVDPASTLQVVNALIKAGKDFDLLFVPGGQHGAGSSPYGLRRQKDFFVKHLLGVEPPKRNAMAIGQRIGAVNDQAGQDAFNVQDPIEFEPATPRPGVDQEDMSI